MTRPPLTPQPPETGPNVHAPGQTPTRRYPDNPQTRTEATRGSCDCDDLELMRCAEANAHGAQMPPGCWGQASQ